MSMRDAFDKADKTVVKEADILRNEIAIFKTLVKEHSHPLDLVRELLSNAGAREVGATQIDVSYTKDKEGHVFEVEDNGCGMNYTGQAAAPGRLDRFLGLGLSAIVGIESDEFSWKGLGAKLSYQSRRVEIETRFDKHPEYNVIVNEPWSSLERSLLPKPKMSEYRESDRATGTRIRVIGHPPHRKDKPFTMAEIRDHLLHRSFAGYTRDREGAPRITLSVLGTQQELAFGFPEFTGIDWPQDVRYDDKDKRLIVNLLSSWPGLGHVVLKGFLTWEGARYGLDKNGPNTGLVFSAKGIPYFDLDMEEYGARSILRGFPGKGNTCLVVECDHMSAEMNISRSGFVDSAATLEFRAALKQLLEQLETSQEYKDEFRSVPVKKKRRESAEYLAEQKRLIESEDQNWVVLERSEGSRVVLLREPSNENEVNALIWKLEALRALPFYLFQTLGYVGATRGPDLLVNFQEDRESEPVRAATVEVENNFYSYKHHGHLPSQYPKIVCWDAPTSGRKVRLDKTSKRYKFTIKMAEFQVHVFVLKLMDGVKVYSRRELSELGIKL